jgi:hypothetical protein
MRSWEAGHVDTERGNYEIALDRAKAGAPLWEETERKTGAFPLSCTARALTTQTLTFSPSNACADDLTAKIDHLLPFLLAAKASDPANPGEKEARRADREARQAFKERLDGRTSAIQRRLDEERELLLRKQQAFARNREHTEQEEKAFEQYVTDATFRIAILEQRLARADSIKQSRLAEFDARLRSDERLMCLYNPAAWRARQEAESGAGQE